MRLYWSENNDGSGTYMKLFMVGAMVMVRGAQSRWPNADVMKTVVGPFFRRIRLTLTEASIGDRGRKEKTYVERRVRVKQLRYAGLFLKVSGPAHYMCFPRGQIFTPSIRELPKDLPSSCSQCC